MGLPTVGLFTFFSYDPRCLYPETYPEVSTMSTRPALPFPRPVSSKRALCEPVNLVVSVRRLTVGEATALCEGVEKTFEFSLRSLIWEVFTLRVLPWLLRWRAFSPQSAGTPRSRPPLPSSLYISSWPALRAQPWTRRMWWCDRISSWNVEKLLHCGIPLYSTSNPSKTNDLHCVSRGRDAVFRLAESSFQSLKSNESGQSCTQSRVWSL